MSEVKMYKRMIVLNREIVRQGNKRYIIYLPTDLNDIWEELKRRGKKVRVRYRDRLRWGGNEEI